MTRNQRLRQLSVALDSDIEWLEMSLMDYDYCEDLTWASNERIARQLVKMGFTRLIKGQPVRSRYNTIVQMLEAAE